MANPTMPDRCTLFDDFSAKGMWWLPGQPENKVSGEVRFKGDHAVILAVDGSFVPVLQIGKPPSDSLNEQFDIVLGMLDDGQPCTLLQVHTLGWHIGGAGHSRMDYQATVLMMGAQYPDEASLRLSVMEFRLTYLEHWLGANPFVAKGLPDRKGCSLTYTRPEEIETELPDMKVKIVASSTLGMNSKNDFDRHYIHNTVLRIVPPQPMPPMWYWDLLKSLRQFLTILIDDPVFPVSVETEAGEFQLSDGKRVKIPVRIYSVEPNRRMKDGVVHATFMLLTYPEIKDTFGTALQAWIKNEDSLKTIYELFFMGYFDVHIRPRFNFLSLMQALESFHRITIGGEYLSESEYRTVRRGVAKGIPTTIPPDLQTSMKDSLLFANKLTLKSRIQDTLSRLEPATKQAITSNEDEFIRRYADTRDFLTHNDKKKSTAFKNHELRPATEKLRVLLRLLLLKHVGIKETQIVAAIKRNYRLATTLQWEPEPLPVADQSKAGADD